MSWGNERLARLGEAAWCLLLTEAQQRGSPGTPAREVVATGSTGHSRLLKEGECRATWVTALLIQGSASWLQKGVSSLPGSSPFSEGARQVRQHFVATADPGWIGWVSYLIVDFCLARYNQSAHRSGPQFP